MATITVDDTTLHLQLTRAERVWGLHGDIRVPLTSVETVDVREDIRPRGLRAPGLGLPGRRYVGTFRGRGRRTFVSTRRGQRVLRVTLSGTSFDEILVSLPEPERVAAEITGDAVAVR